MSDHINILLIGVGAMAKEYAKVLVEKKINTIAVGRSKEKSEVFFHNTGITTYAEGLDNYLYENKVIPNYAIVATPPGVMPDIAIKLLKHGVKSVLLEKPGGISKKKMEDVQELAETEKTDVFIAYNRRFYSSVEEAKRIIDVEGGVRSFHIEFTEWSHVFDKRDDIESTSRLFLCNSTHVVDLAVYLSGSEIEVVNSIIQGKDEIKWHPSGSVFFGCGMTKSGVPFSYEADWRAPGRWAAYINTRNHRIIFRPLEQLRIMKIGSVSIESVEIDDEIDRDYKPGLYREVEAFLKRDVRLCTLKEQIERLDTFSQISGEVY